MIMKRTALALIIVAFLISALAGVQSVNLGRANPYRELGIVPPDADTKPPAITVFAPQNNSAYAMNTVLFSINVSLPESSTASSTYINYVIYEADWRQNQVILCNSTQVDYGDRIESYNESFTTLPTNLYFQYSQDLTGIPDGNHSIVVTSVAGGIYRSSVWGFTRFMINGSASVFFTIGGSPSISVLSIKNRTYTTTDIPLNFTVNSLTSQDSYSLDGQENVTIAGNTTLTGLANGDHNITIYAKDEAGNIGVSETIHFSVKVPEPFPPTLLVAAVVVVAVVAVVCTGLLIDFRRRSHQREIGEQK
jgi:hypothetical protein